MREIYTILYLTNTVYGFMHLPTKWALANMFIPYAMILDILTKIGRIQ